MDSKMGLPHDTTTTADEAVADVTAAATARAIAQAPTVPDETR